METDESWETFLTSGKVSDYLKYKKCEQSPGDTGVKSENSYRDGYGNSDRTRGYSEASDTMR